MVSFCLSGMTHEINHNYFILLTEITVDRIDSL